MDVWSIISRTPRRGKPSPRPVTPPSPEGTIPPTNFYEPVEPSAEEITFTDPNVSLDPRTATYPQSDYTVPTHELGTKTRVCFIADMTEPKYKVLKDLITLGRASILPIKEPSLPQVLALKKTLIIALAKCQVDDHESGHTYIVETEKEYALRSKEEIAQLPERPTIPRRPTDTTCLLYTSPSPRDS